MRQNSVGRRPAAYQPSAADVIQAADLEPFLSDNTTLILKLKCDRPGQRRSQPTAHTVTIFGRALLPAPLIFLLMTTPEHNAPSAMAAGFLTNAFRVLGEGLRPYVATKTGNRIDTPDIALILRKMEEGWNQVFHNLGREVRSRVIAVRVFRNEKWGHQGVYSDGDVHHILGDIIRILWAVSAEDSAKAVEEMHGELGSLIYGQLALEYRQENHNVDEIRKEFADVKSMMSVMAWYLAAGTEPNLSANQTSITAETADLSDGNPAPISATPISDSSNRTVQSAGITDAPRDNESDFDFLQRGREAFANEQYEEAVTYFIQAVEFNPNQVEAKVLLGYAFSRNQDYEQAIAAFTQAIEQHPDKLQNVESVLGATWYNRGLAYSNNGEYHEAIISYDQAIVSFDQATVREIQIARVWLQRGVAHYGLDDYEQAIADFTQAIDVKPDFAGAWVNLGIIYSEMGFDDYAIENYSYAVELDPSEARAWFNRGCAYYTTSHHSSTDEDHRQAIELAIADYSKAIELNPDFADVWHNRGLAYYDIQDYEQAIANYSKAIELNPESAISWRNRGNAYAQNENYDPAITDYSHAIGLNPYDNIAYQGLDLVTRLRDVSADYHQAIADNPDDPDTWHLRALYFLNIADYDRAVADFSEAIRLNPEDADAHCDRGLAYTYQGKEELATSDYNRAIELKPSFAEAYYNRGLTWRRQGAHNNAIADFDLAIVFKPDYALAYQNRGISHLRLGNDAQARADFNKARDLGVSR